MAQGLDWQHDGRDWPHRERSRFVDAGGLRWHVQAWPRSNAPLLLLIHGTGSSTHSWRDLAPLLARSHAVLSLDLPGHAFTSAAPKVAGKNGASMKGMARGVAALLAALDVQPQAIVGHSAGAAVAVRMALQGQPGLRRIIGLNAALFPLPGVAGQWFSPMAKLLSMNPLVPHLFAWGAGDMGMLHRLLSSTGSKIDATGVALYRRLVANPAHVAGALAMVARWNLAALEADLPQLRTDLHLVVGDKDGTVPPADAPRAQVLLAGATLDVLPGLGHLAHEEAPDVVADLIRRRLKAA